MNVADGSDPGAVLERALLPVRDGAGDGGGSGGSGDGLQPRAQTPAGRGLHHAQRRQGHVVKSKRLPGTRFSWTCGEGVV